MSKTCDIDGCEENGYAVTGLHGENKEDEINGKTVVCRKHAGQLFF